METKENRFTHWADESAHWAKPTDPELGQIIAEQTQRIALSSAYSWEKVLRLHLKPRPSWCPPALWQKLVNLVIVQSEQMKR